MTDLILAIPSWLTDALFQMSAYVLCVAFVSVVMRAWAEWFTPHIEDDDEYSRGNGALPDDAFDDPNSIAGEAS